MRMRASHTAAVYLSVSCAMRRMRGSCPTDAPSRKTAASLSSTMRRRGVRTKHLCFATDLAQLRHQRSAGGGKRASAARCDADVSHPREGSHAYWNEKACLLLHLGRKSRQVAEEIFFHQH